MQYNIYFRRDNWERFKDEENKSKLINKLLEDYYGTPPTPYKKSIVEDSSLENILESKTNLAMKKACCLLPSPCIHWQWNGLDEQYVNILTGEIR